MMYSYIAAAALAGSVSASVLPRTDGCCFQLTASGGESGTIGQLGDGQNRIGGGYAPATYCINNGAITDSSGRGCILTPPTTQFQCDVGATPTPGFSISGSGEVEYSGSSTFYACGASASEYNLYTKPVENQKDCHEVKLSSGGKCAGNGGGGGAGKSSSASAPPAYSSMPKSSPSSVAPPPKSMPPVYSSMPKPSPSSVAPPPKSMPPVYSSMPKPSPSSVAPPPKSMTPPSYSSMPKPSPSSVAPPPKSMPPVYSSMPKSSPSSVAPPPKSMTPPSYSSMPKSAESSAPVPPKSMAPPMSAPSQPAPSMPAMQPPASAPAVCPAPVTVTVTQACPTGAPPASSPKAPASSPVVPAPSMAKPSAAPPASSPASPPVVPGSSMSKPSAAPPAGTPASPPAAGSACQTSLTGAYQTPHLIVPISSDKPNVAQGTSYFGEISSTTSTIFNFDVPADYAGKQCSIVFLFPEKKDLTTADYTFSGSGSLGCSELSSAASQSTSWSNAPSVAKDLGDVAIQPGNSYVVATGACKAGTTQSIELSSKGGLSLHFFEDYNPSPLGLFMTSC